MTLLVIAQLYTEGQWRCMGIQHTVLSLMRHEAASPANNKPLQYNSHSNRTSAASSLLITAVFNGSSWPPKYPYILLARHRFGMSAKLLPSVTYLSEVLNTRKMAI